MKQFKIETTTDPLLSNIAAFCSQMERIDLNLIADLLKLASPGYPKYFSKCAKQGYAITPPKTVFI